MTYASDYIKSDLSKFFEQYLEHPTIPTLLYRIKKSGNGVDVSVVLKSDVKRFGMSILMGDPDNYRSVHVSSLKSNYFFPSMKVEEFKVADELFLINVKELD